MTEGEGQRLNELLATDAQAQQMFVDYAMLDVCLDMLWTNGEEREAAGGRRTMMAKRSASH